LRRARIVAGGADGRAGQDLGGYGA